MLNNDRKGFENEDSPVKVDLPATLSDADESSCGRRRTKNYLYLITEPCLPLINHSVFNAFIFFTARLAKRSTPSSSSSESRCKFKLYAQAINDNFGSFLRQILPCGPRTTCASG